MTERNIFNYSINEGFLWSEVNLKGEKQYFIEGYASTIDEDKAGEILDISAQEDILNQMRNENITLDIEHEEWYSDDGKILPRPKNEKIPVAKIISAELRPKGVWVKAQLNTNLRSFHELWGSIKDGFLKAFSVAFYPMQKLGNIIKHLNLVNVTLTGSPVNPNATFAASMKSAAAWMDSQKKSEEPKMEDEEKKKKLTPEEEEEEEKKKKEKEKEGKPEVKAVEPILPPASESKPEKPVVEPIDVKALQEKYDAALKAQSEEIVKLKAELEKPQLKATVTKDMPKEEPAMMKITPLGLVK